MNENSNARVAESICFLQDKRNAVVQPWVFEQLSYDFLNG